MTAVHGKGQSIPQPANLRAERDRFVALAFCWADVLLELGTDERILFAVGATQPLIGYRHPDLIGQKIKDLVVAEDHILLENLMQAARSRGRIENITIHFKSAKGASVPVLFAGYQLADFDGHYFLAIRKTTTLSHAGEPVSRDQETGLISGESFDEAIAGKVQAAAKAGTKSKVTLIEVADFENYRKRIGATAEKNLMHTVGACLRANSVDGDSAAKLDDDRFSLVHDEKVDVEKVKAQLAEASRQVDPEGKGFELETATLDANTEGNSDEDLANGLAYAINRFARSERGSLTKSNLSLELGRLVGEASKSVNEFKRVIGQRLFFPVFQPIVSVHDGKIHHYEALVRFDKDAGASPFETITFAEETGLIPQFDIAMVEKVVESLSKTPRNGTLSVAINISGASIEDDGYVKDLYGILKAETWTRGRLLFEITESSKIKDMEAANATIQNLRKGGYEVCLDDFGAGAANIDYLHKFDVDVVKFDGPVVKDSMRTHKGKAVLRAMMTLCRDLGVETIAEMIDSPEGLQFVRDCGTDFVQGYLIGKPGEKFLKSGHFKMPI